MKHTVWVALLYFITHFVYAFDSSPSVFYPLPTESQGRVFAAKQLFLATNGGLWIHDVRGNVLFFDGQSVSPKWGSALPYPSEKLVVENDRFWTFRNNSVYRSTSNTQPEIAFQLPPGSEIQHLGTDSGFIWAIDDAHFHAFDIKSGKLSTYSLMELYRYSSSTSLSVNDALLLKDSWVLATQKGVFVSEKQGFRHVARSKDYGVDNLYYSENRRELILGSVRGAVVYDINNTSKPKYIIPATNVTSVSETTHAYWIGTQNGLYVYSFISGRLEKYSGERDAGYTLAGRRIYALVNDNRGGMWISTNKGIHYYSLFGDKFERFPSQDLSSTEPHERMNNLIAMQNKRGYWVVKDSGFYRLVLGKHKHKQLLYSGRVHNLIEHDDIVWLATDNGIVALEQKTGGKINNHPLVKQFYQQKITHLAMDSQGNIWIANSEGVWCYNVENGQAQLIAEQWMQGSQIGAQLKTMLVTSDDELLLGSENGLYLLRDGQLKYFSQSEKYGAVLSMIEGDSRQIWVASNYGVNILDPARTSFSAVPLVDEHIGPQCLIGNQTGIWLTSSAGLTHFSHQGQAIAHYGQPFGLISNELRNSFCLQDASDPDTLLLGSWHSLIRIHSRDLMVSPLPEANVLFSQVRVNQKLVAFGSIAQTEIVAPYGDSISVQMGIMPNISGSSLEYRLDHESDWTQLEGYQIAIEGLTPGKYTLHVRPVVNVLGNGAERSLAFVVTEPWYLSALAFVGYITVALVLLFAAVYWRSRMMSSANRRLKAQVALKTNQLRHQSRILLSNNHQLRKQLQVRRLIFSQAIQAFRDRLGNLELKMDREDHQTQMRVVEQISSELELLLNVRESQGQELPAYNLSMIFNSTFIGWQEELAKAGIAVEFQSLPDTDSYVVLDYFNLDILLNLLFDSLVKRCSRHQIVYVELSCTQDDVILTMTDFGAPIERNAQGHWSEVTTLVATSGGRIEVTQQETQNTVHLAWRRSEAFDENSVTALESLALTSVESDSFDPFIKRVEALVMQHFPDADFSTSTAAKMLFVSERSLQRRFKGATQRTFLDYLTEVRLDNACRYLLAGHKVADVAFECGFNDPSYFSQRFKHRFGMSPTQFVEQSDAQHEEVF